MPQQEFVINERLRSIQERLESMADFADASLRVGDYVQELDQLRQMLRGEIERISKFEAHAPATPAERKFQKGYLEPWCETCDTNDCECPKVNLPVAEAAPTTPTWLHELQDFAKEMRHAPRSTCYDSDERDPNRCQKCYLEQIIREIPGAGQGRKP